ncbi:hypothetical protein [Helicobacter trogontum]|uniref:hypothetical protein n=1 Tax=Helicobacter trogontum TaxID=50960 RepID=UPI000A6BEDC0|nr:hypothetical protein [Helicobacter trogontum]
MKISESNLILTHLVFKCANKNNEAKIYKSILCPVRHMPYNFYVGNLSWASGLN